jgi:endonuclease-3 related protein
VVVGAILTQNTNWKNVERAIANLRKGRLLTPRRILESRKLKVESRIKPAGYYRQKTKKLKAFVNHLFKYHKGSLKRMFAQPVAKLRKELLSIHGIGPETADSIILYAANKPSFVVDAYTRRIGHKLGLFKFNRYDDIKNYFQKNLPKSVRIYNEFHALLVEYGKRMRQ